MNGNPHAKGCRKHSLFLGTTGSLHEKWMTQSPEHHSQTGRGGCCGTPPSSAPGTDLPDSKMRFYEMFGCFPVSCPQAKKLCWLVEIKSVDTSYSISNESQECLEDQSWLLKVEWMCISSSSRTEPTAGEFSSWRSRASRKGTFQDLICIVHCDPLLLPSKHRGFCNLCRMALSNTLELQYNILEKAIPLDFILHITQG